MHWVAPLPISRWIYERAIVEIGLPIDGDHLTGCYSGENPDATAICIA